MRRGNRGYALNNVTTFQCGNHFGHRLLPVGRLFGDHLLVNGLQRLGNVWPQLTDEGDIERAAAGLRQLLRPGGALVMGLKAFALRKDPYLPLLRREHEGKPIWFIRFVDFSPGDPLAEFHMAIVRGEDECVHHRTGTVRVWGPDDLAATFREAGFLDVKVSGVLGEPDAPVKGEDVFLHARA